MKIVRIGRQQKHRRQVWPETGRTKSFRAVAIFRFSTRIHFDQGLSIPPQIFRQTAGHMNQTADSWLPIVPVRHEQPAELRYDETKNNFETN